MGEGEPRESGTSEGLPHHRFGVPWLQSVPIAVSNNIDEEELARLAQKVGRAAAGQRVAWGPWDASRGLALGRCSPVLVTPGGFSYLGPGAASSPPVAVLSPPARDSGEFPLPHPHLALDSVTCLDLESQRSPHPSGDSEDQCPPQAHPPWGPCPCLP